MQHNFKKIIMTQSDLSNYQRHYSEGQLWNKIKDVARKASVKVLYAALLLYYVLKDPNTPAKDKAIIVGALGYFILPIDLIPDMIPVAGFTDDLTALVLALRSVWVNVTPEIKAQAQNKLAEWFATVSESDLKIF